MNLVYVFGEFEVIKVTYYTYILLMDNFAHKVLKYLYVIS